MSLKIQKKKSVYHLQGVINKTTVDVFLSYFKKKIDKKKKVVLNIDETIRIDKMGLNALKEIIKNGSEKSKEVFIVGYGCKEIYDDMLKQA